MTESSTPRSALYDPANPPFPVVVLGIIAEPFALAGFYAGWFAQAFKLGYNKGFAAYLKYYSENSKR